MAKIPEDVIEELKLKEPKEALAEEGRIIVEKYQMSIRLPRRIRPELELKEGSYKCDIIVKDKRTILAKIKNG